MYLIPGDVQVKDVETFEYEEFLTVTITTRAYWKAAKVVETHEPEGHCEVGEEHVDVLEKSNYLSSSEIPKERAIMPLLEHSVLFFCS